MAHLLAVPLLATPTAAFRVDDAGAATTAAWVFDHAELLALDTQNFSVALEAAVWW
jgi:hypothetical protein